MAERCFETYFWRHLRPNIPIKKRLRGACAISNCLQHLLRRDGSFVFVFVSLLARHVDGFTDHGHSDEQEDAEGDAFATKDEVEDDH